MRLTYLSLAALIGLAMAVTQHFAFIHSWYWTYWWLDWAMHFSGALVLTLIGGAYLGVRPRVIFVTLVLSVLWEVYEYAIGISRSEPNFVADTLSDLSMDVAGALCAYGMMHLWQTYRSPFAAAHGASPDQTSSLP